MAVKLCDSLPYSLYSSCFKSVSPGWRFTDELGRDFGNYVNVSSLFLGCAYEAVALRCFKIVDGLNGFLDSTFVYQQTYSNT